MKIPDWARVAYYWGNSVCYSDHIRFSGWNTDREVWKGQWDVPGTQDEEAWVDRMRRTFPETFKVEHINLIEENE